VHPSPSPRVERTVRRRRFAAPADKRRLPLLSRTPALGRGIHRPLEDGKRWQNAGLARRIWPTTEGYSRGQRIIVGRSYRLSRCRTGKSWRRRNNCLRAPGAHRGVQSPPISSERRDLLRMPRPIQKEGGPKPAVCQYLCGWGDLPSTGGARPAPSPLVPGGRWTEHQCSAGNGDMEKGLRCGIGRRTARRRRRASPQSSSQSDFVLRASAGAKGSARQAVHEMKSWRATLRPDRSSEKHAMIAAPFS
jgi:hypothetical protein